MLILCFLILDVFSYHFFIPPNRGYEVPSGPEVLAYEVALLSAVHPSQVYRTLAFDKPDDLRHCIFRRDRYQHVHMIRHGMTFYDHAFLLLGQIAEYFPHVLPQLPEQRFSPILRNEYHMIFALPLGVA